ncbi:MAG TPA: phosphatidate cytidylyltransferase [Jatrophihabitans sp.]|jgi:phosphatidate cytidylyltransferase|uniref:phosphatidate cytidylyltransferase n=1 Tax=Jatrophihabitans sp. TaxID=1932789 RepID=UPI002E058697|nr:phosphatidate cytidylyltransferase [Jatrophihabitans sp.]
MTSDDPRPAEPESPPSAVARARRVAGQAPISTTRPKRHAGAQPGVTWVAEQPTGGPDDIPEPVPASKAGRNLPVAIAVGAGLGAVVLASLFIYRPSFAVLVGVAVLYACYELTHALRAGGIRASLTPILVGGAAVLVAAWTRGPGGLVLAVLVTVLGLLVWRVADGAHGYTRDVAASMFTVLYVPTLAGFAVLLAHPDDGAARVVAFVATVVCSDTGGYAAGVLFGRHPLAPIVSKAKTWEGFAGSVAACSAAGIAFLTLTFHEAWWKGLLFGLAVVVTATLGDLGESMIKRDLKIKDMGKLLPGHGGLMDRLDSLLPCAAVAYLVLSAFAPVG